MAKERFYEGDELLAEITDTHLIVHKRGQQYEYSWIPLRVRIR